MPVKRRSGKRRADTGDEMDAWTDVFLFGWDFSRGLEMVGVPSTLGKPDRVAAQDAWRRLGERFLIQWGQVARVDPLWAQREFGEPHAR